LVEDGANGLLVPVDDAKALAVAVRRLLGDTALRDRLIERGRADYLKDFTREAATQRMLAVYRHILEAHEAGCARAGAHGKDGT
jgi:glycosyltransferase involved in cell wall biosynthesis